VDDQSLARSGCELRRWLDANGYRTVEKIEDGAWSGGDLQRPGLDRANS
jgi:hypothetical protein